MPVALRGERHAQARGTERVAGLTRSSCVITSRLLAVVFSWLFVGQIAELAPQACVNLLGTA